MTPDLSLRNGFARGLLLSLQIRDTCLHSGSWLLSGFIKAWIQIIDGLRPQPCHDQICQQRPSVEA